MHQLYGNPVRVGRIRDLVSVTDDKIIIRIERDVRNQVLGRLTWLYLDVITSATTMNPGSSYTSVAMKMFLH